MELTGWRAWLSQWSRENRAKRKRAAIIKECIRQISADNNALTVITIDLEGRLREIITKKTAKLYKRELQDFDARTGRWKGEGDGG